MNNSRSDLRVLVKLLPVIIETIRFQSSSPPPPPTVKKSVRKGQKCTLQRRLSAFSAQKACDEKNDKTRRHSEYLIIPNICENFYIKQLDTAAVAAATVAEFSSLTLRIPQLPVAECGALRALCICISRTWEIRKIIFSSLPPLPLQTVTTHFGIIYIRV